MAKQFKADAMRWVPLLLLVTSVAAHGGPVAGQGTWETTLQARDINNDGTVDAYYDTALNITWLANWNVNGLLSWGDAKSWAAGLNLYGITGWRLPSTTDTGPPGCDWSAGGTDCGYNVDTSTSEMAHMFYVTLGDLSICVANGDPLCHEENAYFGLTNTGPFSNMQDLYYWSGTPVETDSTRVWVFGTDRGDQGTGPVDAMAWAVAVHPGDIGGFRPVAEPATIALLGLSLVGLAFSRRSSDWQRRVIA